MNLSPRCKSIPPSGLTIHDTLCFSDPMGHTFQEHNLDPNTLFRKVQLAKQLRFDLLYRQKNKQQTSAFCLFNRTADGLAGLAIEKYDQWLVVRFFDEQLLCLREPILDILVREFTPRGIYIKIHPRKASTMIDPKSEKFGGIDPACGDPAPEKLKVFEFGKPFWVWLADGLNTGLFVDQRINRSAVYQQSSEKAVLNLFCYSATFSVQAVRGGAKRVVSVDAARSALKKAQENFDLSGTSTDSHPLIRDEVFRFVRKAAKKPERYDLIIIDPPTYSMVDKQRFTSGKDWIQLISSALLVLAPQGELLLCSNDTRLSIERFGRLIVQAVGESRYQVTDLKNLFPPSDCHNLREPSHNTKSFWLRLKSTLSGG